jgi:ligand-binding SRPBCC domain-containing protein
MIHYLHREQILPVPSEILWKYFSEPKNLNLLTPPDMNFEIITGGEAELYEGQIIEYKVEFIHGVRSLWLTEIVHVREIEYFVDEQRVGPYRFWYHEHTFQPLKNGVKMTDHVTYVAPFGFLGEIVHAIWLRQRLKTIFDFRRQKISEIFGSAK